MKSVHRAAPCALLASMLAGCATTAGPADPGDPLERFNRGTHRFNEAVDRAVLRPVAVRYERHVPGVIRTGIGNLLTHLAYPTTIVNDLLQLKLKDAAIDVGRFVLNTTLGIGGLLDPASAAGLARNDEDFGQTLGRWGVPPGPYLVLPLLGPSTARDAPSLYVDSQTDLRVQAKLKDAERAALSVVSVVDRRAQLLSIDRSVTSAYDSYAFVRDAWLQRREYKVRDGDVPEETPLEDPGVPEDPLDQPPPAAAAGSKSETSLMPASADSAGGRFR